MTVPSGPGSGTATSFRAKLLLAMMLVVSALTILGVYLAQKNVAATTQRDLKQSFEAELSWLNRVQQLRNAALKKINAGANQGRSVFAAKKKWRDRQVQLINETFF